MITADLSTTESTQLAEYETIIGKGLATFVDVGNALLAIREERLYRLSHGTFEDYCKQRWQLSNRRANQLIVAATITEDIAQTGTIVPENEGQARPLAALPSEQRPAAFKEAVEKTNGKPTAKAVQEAVDRRITPKPKPEPKPSPIVLPKDATPNGFKVASVTEPDSTPAVETFEPGDGPDEDATDDSDESFLSGLALRAKLAGPQLRNFDRAATLYREIEAARKTFAHHATRALNKDRRRDTAYGYLVSQFLKVEHPKHWILCAAPEFGGCGGTGEVLLIGQCPHCHGRGYRIR